MLKQLLAATSILLLMGGAHAHADDAPLKAELEARTIIVDETGTEQFAPAESVTPGSLIEYTMRYENVSDADLEGFIINGEIPSMTEFVAESEKTNGQALFEVHVEDIGWSEIPVTRYLPDDTGVLRAVIVAPEEYNGLRWRLREPLRSGQIIEAHYRVKVDN